MKLNASQIAKRVAALPDWQLADDGRTLLRRLELKGFAKACHAANLAAFLSDRTGHHADIRFGWGYCEIRFTTHDAGGLTQTDFDNAARFDRLVDAGG